LGSETGKIRSCVIVTNDVYNERVPVIQVVPVMAWSGEKVGITTNMASFNNLFIVLISKM
jgi:mRNA interferase MazF